MKITVFCLTLRSLVDAHQLFDECPASIYRAEESLHLSRKDKEQNSLAFFIQRFLNIWTLCVYTKDKYVRFEVLKGETTKINYFWDMMPYDLVDTYQCIRGTYCLQEPTYQEILAALLRVLPEMQRLFFTMKKNTVYSSKTMVNIYQTILHHIQKRVFFNNARV
jgi:fructose-1,6-bisphosphatase